MKLVSTTFRLMTELGHSYDVTFYTDELSGIDYFAISDNRYLVGSKLHHIGGGKRGEYPISFSGAFSLLKIRVCIPISSN